MNEGYVNIVDQNGVIYNIIKSYIYPEGRTYNKPSTLRPNKPYGYYIEKPKETIFLLEVISEVSTVSETFPDKDIPKEFTSLPVITSGETYILDSIDSINMITQLGEMYGKFKLPAERAKYIFNSYEIGSEFVDEGQGTTLKCVKLEDLKPNW